MGNVVKCYSHKIILIFHQKATKLQMRGKNISKLLPKQRNLCHLLNSQY